MFTNDSDAMRTIAGLQANEAKQALTAAVTGFGQEAVDELVNESVQPSRGLPGKTSVYHVIDALTSDEAKTALGLLVDRYGHVRVEPVLVGAKPRDVSLGL